MSSLSCKVFCIKCSLTFLLHDLHREFALLLVLFILVGTEEIIQRIKQFEERFNLLKRSTKQILIKQRKTKSDVIQCLTELPADDRPDHKMFLKKELDALYESRDLEVLFSKLNLYWDYFNYGLLDHLIRSFKISEVKKKMECFKRDLKLFLFDTSLNLYCETQKKRHYEIPPGFEEMVFKFDWPEHITLDAVNRFRGEYVAYYCLRECAMMVVSILNCSFIVTFYVPKSIVQRLIADEGLPRDRFEKFNVQNVKINGKMVYEAPQVNCFLSFAA